MGFGADVTRLLVISNGHGEDFIAARLGEALRKRLPRLDIEAFPLVGVGQQLRKAGLSVRGPTKRLPSDGFTMHHPMLIWRDTRAGLLGLTLRQAQHLRKSRPDAVLVVGDVYAQMHAALVRAPRRVLQPLVSVYHLGEGALGYTQAASEALSEPATPAVRKPPRSSPLRYFMERFRGPELFLLKRAQKVYTRDAATASFLQALGVKGSAYLGNPMMDGLQAEPVWTEKHSAAHLSGQVVALLPGSREQAPESVSTMLGALRQVPGAVGLVAWTHPLVPPVPAGWEENPVAEPVPGLLSAWSSVEGGQHVWWLKGRFASVLASARAAMGTAGTANEQAVGLGLPVVAFEVPPLFGRDYLRNQARLLGAGLLVCEPHVDAVASTLRKALFDDQVRHSARQAGQLRMGGPGASAALADDLAEWLAGLGSG